MLLVAFNRRFEILQPQELFKLTAFSEADFDGVGVTSVAKYKCGHRIVQCIDCVEYAKVI